MEIIFIWIVLAIILGMWADAWGRHGGGYALLSLVFSPIIATIVLLISGNKRAQLAAETLKTQEQQHAHELQLQALRALAQPGRQTTNTSISIADEIAKLADLQAKGILTEAEAATQKQRLLSQ